MAASQVDHFASISAGAGFACGVLKEGSAVCWGNDNSFHTDTPPGGFNLRLHKLDNRKEAIALNNLLRQPGQPYAAVRGTHEPAQPRSHVVEELKTFHRLTADLETPRHRTGTSTPQRAHRSAAHG